MTMSVMDTNRMISWFMARLGARRVTKVMPMPERKKTMGRIAGSAPGDKDARGDVRRGEGGEQADGYGKCLE